MSSVQPVAARSRAVLLATSGLLVASLVAFVAPINATAVTKLRPAASQPHSTSHPYTCQGVVTNSTCTLTFTAQDQWQDFTVPDGVSSIDVEASGAYGGGFCDPYDYGGAPGGVNGTLAVSDGEALKFFVGGQGAYASLTSTTGYCPAGNGHGGYGGGGNGGFSGSVAAGYRGYAGGGGGATTVVANGVVEFVAGGGGGTGQGGNERGYLQEGFESIRPGAGGAGGGGVNRPDEAYTGTAVGFAGQGVGGDCDCQNQRGASGGTVSGPGTGPAGATFHGQPMNGLVSATAQAGKAGAGPASASGAGTGGQGAGASNACEVDNTRDQPEVWDSEGGGGGGGYYGGGGGGCGLYGGMGGGGGSSYFASDVTQDSYKNLINPPIATLYPTLNGHYSNVTGGLLSLSFEVCSDNADSNSAQTPGAHALAHAAGPSCPLTVTVKQQNKLRSGYSINDLEKDFGPINFTSETSGGGLTALDAAGLKCNSGCANLLVTVTLPNSTKPVANATVAASVAQAAGDSSDSRTLGTDFLCVQTSADVPTCGTYVSGLQTDSRGQVHLLYWAPGVVPGKTSSTWQTTLTVKATKCSSTCGSGERKGESDSTLSVKDYPIYRASGQLTSEQVTLLIDLVKDDGFHVNPADSITLDKMTESTVEFLEATERETLANLIRLPAAYGEAALEVYDMGVAIKAYGEQGALGGTFLNALNLSAIGFGEPPFEKTPPLLPSDAFMTQLEGGFSRCDYPRYAEGGALHRCQGVGGTDERSEPTVRHAAGEYFGHRVRTFDLRSEEPQLRPGVQRIFRHRAQDLPRVQRFGSHHRAAARLVEHPVPEQLRPGRVDGVREGPKPKWPKYLAALGVSRAPNRARHIDLTRLR